MNEFRARMLHVGDRIRSERTKRGLTQKALSYRSKFAIPQISEWENGRKIPTPHSLSRIADAIEIPIEVLLGDLSDLSEYQFGERLKTLRHANGMTLQDLSVMADVSHATISLWETGAAEPKASDVGRLAKALGISCDLLIFGQD